MSHDFFSLDSQFSTSVMVPVSNRPSKDQSVGI